MTNATLEIAAGSTAQIDAAVEPADATNQTLVYASGNTNVATVNDTGLVTAVAAGTTNITVTVSGTEVSTVVAVTVPVVLPTSISVTKPETSLTLGSTEQIEYVVKPNDAADKTVAFTSNDETVCTVTSEGLITAIGEGTTTINVVANAEPTVTATVTVTVTAA